MRAPLNCAVYRLVVRKPRTEYGFIKPPSDGTLKRTAPVFVLMETTSAVMRVSLMVQRWKTSRHEHLLYLGMKSETAMETD
jgi:hypothetical protein